MNTLTRLVGLRYLAARKGSRFVSLFSLASILGMAVSVMVMVVVLSVMNGFEAQMRNRILHAMPHAQVSAAGGLEHWDALAAQLLQQAAVLAASPQQRARVLLAADERVRGAELFGIDPEREMQVANLGDALVEGSWDTLRAGSYGVVLGQSLARYLRVAVGDSVTVMLPQVSVTPLGLFPRSRRFTVIGIFSVGAQVDATQLYIHLNDAGRLLRRADRVDALRLRFADVLRAPAQVDALRNLPALAGFTVSSWRDEYSTLFNAIRMEKIMVSLMLAVIVAVAVFNLVSILTMAVSDRRNDIAVLRTLGASRATILGIFLLYGVSMGAIGIGVGSVLGSVLAWHIGSIAVWLEQLIGRPVLDPQVFFVSSLPSEWQAQQVAGIVLLASALCVLAVFYPAWRASRIQPAEALRYE